jgi:hypothetical protein
LKTPAGYCGYLGNRPYFERLQSTPDTLHYNSRQRQIVFYDKTEEAAAGDVRIPDILRNGNLFRYVLRYTKRLAGQLNGPVRAAKPYDAAFYRSVIQRRYSEFKTISKINKTGMDTDILKAGCTGTPEEAKDALFAMPGQMK